MLKVLSDETGKSQTAEHARGTKRILLWGIAVVVGVAILACFILTAPAATSRPVYFRIGLGALISILLAALPLLISFVQTTSRDRQLAKLHSIYHSAAAETDCYKIAVNALGAIKPASLDKDYTLPMLTFATAVVFGCLLVFLGAFEENFFRSKSFVLGGMAVLDLTDEAAISSYQRSSFLAGSMAFVGSYVYVLSRLLDRTNNNDIYPISFYYYTARFVIACLAAIVFRHVLDLLGIKTSESYGSQAIVLVGFVTGLAPDLFITAMARRAFQMIKVSGAQNDPDESVLPTNLSLLMIEGLSRDKIDRLTELGIDNSQVLANQNPFILWPRLPYDLTLIVDWIAQAQLYKFAKEEGTKRLRSKGIDNICALYAALSNADAAASVAELIQVSASTVPAYITIFDQDPSFRRLREVRGALADAAPDGQPESGSGAAP